MINANELNKLVEQIRKDYILIPKGKLWMMLGGFIGILAAVGLTSYGSAKAVLESSTTKQVESEIQRLRDEAQLHVKEIKDMRNTHRKQLEALDDKVSYNSNIEIINAAKPELRIDVSWPQKGEPRNGSNLQVYSLGNPKAQIWQIKPRSK